MMLILRAFAAFFLIAAAVPAARGADAPMPAVNASNTLQIEPNKMLRWNGTLIDEPMLRRILKATGKKKPAPEIYIEAGRLARYDEVARILTIMQQNGAARFGFTGINSGK